VVRGRRRRDRARGLAASLEARAVSERGGRLGRRAFAIGIAAAAMGCTTRRSPDASPGPRVVSLSPSTTEALFAIGAGELVVGRSRYCDAPPEAARLPAVGGFADPSIESIVALRPTLVVGARGPAGPVLAKTLEARGIATAFPETESFAQIEAMIRELGDRLGHQEGARAVVAAMEARRAAVATAVASRPRVRALFLFDAGPIVAAGPSSFPDELLRLAGGANVVTEGGAYPTLGLERVVALDPDVILDATAMARADGSTSALPKQPGFRDLRAAREGRVRPIDGASALRPGPRIGDGLAVVARALHQGIAL
jgi:iron complex transport system substrate-binding protein